VQQNVFSKNTTTSLSRSFTEIEIHLSNNIMIALQLQAKALLYSHRGQVKCPPCVPDYQQYMIGINCGIIREGMMEELKRRVEGQEAEVPGILNAP